MAFNDYLPARESDYQIWMKNFNAFISATPTLYGLTAAQATALDTLFINFNAAFNTATNNSTRTPSAIQAKNDAKVALTEEVRGLVKIIQAYPGTTNEMRVDLGIRVPDVEPTPVPPPTEAPQLVVDSLMSRVLTLKIRNADEDSRGKPAGVAGATLLMHVGEDAPLDPTTWVFLMNTTKTTAIIDFPSTIAAGAKVWITGFWRNRRDEAGPAATPVSVRLGDSMAIAA